MFRYARTCYCQVLRQSLYVFACTMAAACKDTHFAKAQVKKFNGVPVENLRHLSQLTAACTERFMRFDLDYEVLTLLCHAIWQALV
jgi:PDZ domain